MWAGRPSITALKNGTATFDEALGGVAAIGAWALLVWIVLVLAGTALAAVPGVVGRASSRAVSAITPVATRRTARLALGVAVAAGPVVAGAGPAAAHSPGGTAGGPVATQVAGDASDLPLVERPTRPDQTPRPAQPVSVASLTGDPSEPETPEPPATHGRETPEQETPEPDTPELKTPERETPERETSGPTVERDSPEPPTHVMVQRGDSLWTIAARHLGPDASDAQVAAAWPRWYEANRDVIGDDPNLIMPGIALTPPDAS